ncbi:MAG: plasmid stabilization protein [Nitrospirae bacterium CG_4_10_14_3_um_filter_44_29]|nr:type II toxin-antitoxin system RelE/ParE family toxin [Nitrospirota bacterium]OIO30143.1 MAG: plasmid stabilization protein [Nitrospirae bacterium CG1_02_44_142]PIP71159.1 MAG: plasmid stabilization protein [Nitrospirae bacterium CG22_combo_CG10-13_8_21_14_all_44_11]PIV44258.1 MAG: plasmid stabilization protein [Nitrospirae bacterium CG02_land_8_20_14_3_00_44_33]PIV67031.1 MAG: plasmid stabilization protein [Nitrospirae bacterium CG01_land_8_20_14_3_00_44_22]PIW90148.1 MAG: plasmid stabiliz
MEIRFLEIAQIELDETIEYYNSESPGLGDSFLLEALNTIERIRHFPNAWQPFSSTTRRCQLRRFPYGIIYQILNTEILVVAVANLHRKPDYWQDRIKE